MKLGIMQPYFFPYLGYFHLISNCDVFILFDDAQYIRHGWINRNRIFSPNPDGWQYIGVNLKKHSRATKIREVQIDHNSDWERKISRQLQIYQKAKDFEEVSELVSTSIGVECIKLVDLNYVTIKAVCSILEIDTVIHKSSQLNFDYSKVSHPGQWALEISQQFGASTYINPISGRDLFVKEEFSRAGVNLEFSSLDQLKRHQSRNFSILDDLLTHGVNPVRDWLNRV